MDVEMKAYVVDLLESYQKREKQIELLHYELAHPASISEGEMIGAMSLAHGEGGGCVGGHISDKTFYIALNYQERTERANRGATSEIACQLVALESQQERLKYYVSLLNARQAEMLELLYFEGYTQEESAQKLGITARTVRRIKDDAILKLTELYCFAGEISGDACPKAVL